MVSDYVNHTLGYRLNHLLGMSVPGNRSLTFMTVRWKRGVLSLHRECNGRDDDHHAETGVEPSHRPA